MNALTEEERRFAAENHRLITAFLIRKRLRADEYYAIAALGYLGAVQRYLSEPALRRLAFSTVAERAMRRSVFTASVPNLGAGGESAPSVWKQAAPAAVRCTRPAALGLTGR